MSPKSIESSLQDLYIELLRSKIGQPLHLPQNVVGSWLGTLVQALRCELIFSWSGPGASKGGTGVIPNMDQR